MKDKIQTYIQLFLDDVELNISVKDDLSCQDGNLKNFGYIQITDGSIEDKPIFWDGIEFLLSAGKKEFKEECGKQLKKKGYNWRETYKTIKTLLKQAKKLNLITE